MHRTSLSSTGQQIPTSISASIKKSCSGPLCRRNQETISCTSSSCKPQGQHHQVVLPTWPCFSPFIQRVDQDLSGKLLNISTKTTREELFSIVQEPDQSLRSFVKWFSKAIAKIPNYNDIVAWLNFKMGLTPNSSFLNEICSRKPKTIVEALARAQGLIECEGINKTPHANGH